MDILINIHFAALSSSEVKYLNSYGIETSHDPHIHSPGEYSVAGDVLADDIHLKDLAKICEILEERDPHVTKNKITIGIELN